MEKESILIVDDDIDILSEFKNILETEGYEVTTAENGEAALKLIKENIYNLVLSDIVLGGIDGIRVLQETKKICPETEVILITGYAAIETAIGALRLGADDYILKPCNSEELNIRIKRALEKQKLRRKHKQAEEALRESEEKYRDLFENANDLIQCVDADGSFVYANRKWLETLGYSIDELEKLKFTDILRKDKIPHCMEIFKRVSSGESLEKVETVFVTKDGREIDVEGNINAQIKDGEFIATRVIFRDITERKKAEEEINRLMSGIEQAYDLVVITDTDGKILYVNPAFENKTGYSKKEVIGQNPRILKSGEQPGSFYKEMWDTILQGNIWYGNLINKKKNGDLYNEEMTITPVKNKDNKITNFVAIKRDVTKKKELEENINRLRRENEAFMRHELKNLMAPIKGYSDLLLTITREGLSEKQERYILKIKETVDRTIILIDYLKKLQDFEMGKVNLQMINSDLNGIIKNVLFDLKILSDENNVKVKFKNKAIKSNMQMDYNLLPGVFNNLIKNAIEHIINLENESEKVVKVDMFNVNSKIVVKINNKGEPIPTEKLQRFFEKFNTDRVKKSGGTGLGTTYAYLVTKAHSGDISVESNGKDGTTVTVKLKVLK